MELCEASRSPLPALGRGVPFRHNGLCRGRCSLSPFITIRVPTTMDILVSPINIHNSLRKSQVVSIQKGNGATSVGLCKVLWSVEADVEDGQLLYITGDLVALGCWDPDLAILLSPSKENAKLWKAEVKIPSGIHFKYNYFIKGRNQSTPDLVWRPGPEFSLSIPCICKKGESITVRDLWLVSPVETPPLPLWTLLLDVLDYSSFQEVRKPSRRSRGKHRGAKGLEINESKAKNFSEDLNNVNCVVIDDVKVSAADSGQIIEESNQHVEEPWLMLSVSLSAADASLINVPDQESSKITLLEDALQVVENIQVKESVEDHSLVQIEDCVSTVILINSSVCTMQRIAILEDGKLVELLLEPVKNNVQCDSVYLGVVTKLVPHMEGAFVDIGISRRSFMDIKRNRKPFTYPPFRQLINGVELNGSVITKQRELLGSRDSEIDLYADDNINEEVLDSTLHIMHDDVDEHDGEDGIDDSAPYKSNIANGNVDYSGVEADLEFCYEENGLTAEEDAVEESDSLETHNQKGMRLSDILLQDSTDTSEGHSDKNKWSHVRQGTRIIVQVIKEGLGTKGPELTAHPNLRSRFWVLMTRCNRIGVSRKVTGVERTRLRVIAKKLQPPGFGLTVRTVAAGHSLEELQKDLEGLLSTWKGIVEHAKSAALAADEGVEGAVPTILHRAMGQTLSVVQDYFNDKVKSMVVDSPRTYHEVTSYLQELAPNLFDRVLLYNKRTPIFDEYGIEEEIDNILCKRVLLYNGGYLVIEQTEALVSIDVNGGVSMLRQGTSQEKAVLDVNLAAAKQIARELRLRDIGGIIVVDFIDMVDEAHKRLVYEEMKTAVEGDKSMVKVSELSRNGLMEITRKRVRPSVSFLVSEPCSCCQATGRVEALETSYSKIEREICRILALSDQKTDNVNAKPWPRIILKVDRYMCNYLTSGKRTKLAIMSSSLKVWILLKVARGFARGAFEVAPFAEGTADDDDDDDDDDKPVRISRLHSAEARSYIPNSKLTIFPVKKWKAQR